jgi:DNA segregation ATPase FtsK/SpoIIIE, S-DNA-T family
MPDTPTKKIPANQQGVERSQNPRRRFSPGQRDPLQLPSGKIEIPPPPQHPGPPPTLNLLTTLMPPIVIVGINVVTLLLSKNINPIQLIASLGMAVGFPVATLLSYSSQKNLYKTNLAKREQAYRQRLEEERRKLEGLIQKQRIAMENSYPSLPVLTQNALKLDKSLWSRRPRDDDFLDLRFGLAAGVPSFSIEPLRQFDQNDKLPQLAVELIQGFQQVPNLPALISFSKIGSLALSGKSTSVYGMARHLVLDLVINHSPQDMNLAVLGDTREAVENWEWLKWLPHTDSLGAEQRIFRLAFDSYKIDKYLEFLIREFNTRRNLGDGFSSSKAKTGSQPAIVVLLDDSGKARLHNDIRTLAEWGHEAGIYLIFVGGRDWPRECRARMDLLDERNYKLTETWSRSSEPRVGIYESASRVDCERVARKLSGWEVAGSGSRVSLPESIRISRVLGSEAFQVEAVKQSWGAKFEPRDLLQFPIGLCARRDQLDLAMINLLPAERGGNDAYHTILIGTTGSGKSEFMKSLVMGAAVRYPPNLLNFFFLDFKGGAAFGIFEDLPHVSGVVTNLKPELVERALDSIENEIDRRQYQFKQINVQNIWDYNKRNQDQPLPHLILLLDEFARGLADFPRLRETLDTLVRQGRSLGVYLILANQDVNSEVDKLLTNVGWRIALKVARPEELSMIDRALPNASRAGQGYLRSLAGDVTEFQAGYAGLPILSDVTASGSEFSIYEIGADGSYKQVFKKVAEAVQEENKGNQPVVKEEEKIISTLKLATEESHIKPAPRIYLDPLPDRILLESVFMESGIQACFNNNNWTPDNEQRRAVAGWGEVDIPQLCLQEMLKTDFADKDGHLWIVGAKGSGMDITLESLVMSLALRYTPEQAQFYLLELGGDELAKFEGLPHTGALIRPRKENKKENERLSRLLDFLDQQMEVRKEASASDDCDQAACASLFVIINSFAELQKNFPDEVERLTRSVRDGGPLGIHFIITTSRGPELIRSISNIISRRLVLQMANKDEYIDIVGRQVRPLTDNIPGRAYWVDGDVAICQIAQPPERLREMIRGMRESWTGGLPKRIDILSDNIPLSDFLSKAGVKKGSTPVPVGQSYTTMTCIAPELTESSPAWLILGPKESGKSNFLACVALSAVRYSPEDWDVRVYSLRRSSFVKWDSLDERIRLRTIQDEIIQDAQELASLFKEGKPVSADGKSLLLLIDELGAAFQPGKENLAKALNDLGQQLESAANVFVMASGLLDELRMQLGTPMVKYIRQNRVGMVLSKDSNEADWLGSQIALEYKRMTLPAGRGFYISRGKAELVQTPSHREEPA